MVSMKDIARECNVSVATVSKALNGYSDIGRQKREEIQETARRLGYFPNSSARALKTKRTWNLGVLFSDATRSGLTHSYFAAILDSFKVYAEERGYDITFVGMGQVGGRRMSYYEHCRYRGLDGVVIANIDFTTPEVQELIDSSLPVVTIDFSFGGRTMVASDNRKGMYDLTRYVLSMGHRKLAYIHGDGNTVTLERMESFLKATGEYGIAVPQERMPEGRFRDVACTEKLTLKVLSSGERPTCIFFPDDYAAVGGINAIRRSGLRVPDDISICGYDGIPISEAVSPRMTTLRQDTRRIGQTAARELIAEIEQPDYRSGQIILIEGKVSEGGSVRRIQEDGE